MSSSFNVVVTLALGTREVRTTSRDLGILLDSPTLERQLLALVLGRQPARPASPETWGTTGGEKKLPAEPATLNANRQTCSSVCVQGWEGVRGGEGTAAVDSPVDDTERVAVRLASRLGDEKSLRYFKLVARVVPREVIRDALDRALDARTVRRSRAALFASIVRPYTHPSNPR